MDVILINPPHSFIETHRGGAKSKKALLSYPPLGLLYIASTLEKQNITVRVIDAPADGSIINEIIEITKKEKPAIVGITSTTPQTRSAVNLAKKLRTNFGNSIHIGLGGAHVSADPSFIDRFPYFDFALTGEGEQTFLEITKMILSGSKIKGIFRGEASNNLDSIPFPARHLVNKELYFMPITEKKFTSILTSRGCPYDCLYCSRPVIGKNVRFRSPENVVAEMKSCIEKFGVEWFQFVDDSFTLNKNRILQFCQLLAENKIDVEWGCQTRIDLIDEPILRAMYKAGCREISFGVESGSKRVRSILRKKFSDESVFEAFKLCRSIGIETTAFLLMGLPTETCEELYQTANFGKKIDADYIETHVSTPFPGSDLYTIAVNEGVIANDVWDEYVENESATLPLYFPNSLTREEVLKAQKHAYREFYFRASYILRRLNQDIHSAHKLKRDISVAMTLLDWKPKTRKK